jgi:glyoxylase-like metal-dependent hydrolase (beta-lactamase superfamily II)/rhodanese-related sulfurtransferase
MRRIAIILFISFLHTISQAESKTAGQLLQEVNQRINNVNTQQLQEMIAKHPETLVIDVRTPEEILLRGGTIDAPHSTNIIAGWLPFRIADRAANKDARIVVFCGVNERSPLAADQLMQLGYTNVYNYADGFFAWQKAGLPIDKLDHDLSTGLYRKPEQVQGNVWSAIGATAPPTYANAGHNNNFSFIITHAGVVLINASDNYLLAKAMHLAIKEITDQPVKYVVWENGQGHAVGGSQYWKEQGAHIIAHEDAAHEVATYGRQILERITMFQRDKAMGTRLVMPDETFTDKKIIELGGERIELLHLGPAHSPGDIMVWLPGKKLAIAGDMAFHQRLLPIFEHTDTAGWIETWDKFVALKPEVIIPGHGDPTTLDVVEKYTMGYIKFLRGEIEKLTDEGGTLADIRKIDQSAYSHLDTYEELAVLNASTLYRLMEFE